jgi:hypothetical protein
MVILKIKEKGYYITIPGITPFRTPAEVDITSSSLPIVVSTLRSNGIEKFEIVSDTPGKKATYTQKDFAIFKQDDKKDEKYESLTAQLDQVKGMLSKLLERNVNEKREQIIERIIEKRSDSPVVEEIEDMFIPTINVGEGKIKTKTESISKEEDIFNNVDLLNKLSRGKK